MSRHTDQHAIRLPQDPAQPWRPPRRPAGVLARLSSWLLPWRERRHAVRTCRAMLTVYRWIAASQPGLPERTLQRRLVMHHLGKDELAAEAVLLRAEESFASWPVQRDLTLCDIVHYVAFDQFVAAGKGDGWIHSDIALTIRAEIPQELWLAHPQR